MTEVRYGIVGLGNQGTHYFLGLFGKGEIPSGRVTAVCDIDPQKIERVKGKYAYGEVAYFDDYIRMLDSGLVDVVLVETPHYFHPEIAIECLKRNINVIVDKPAGVYAAQVRELNEAAERSSAKFAMMFNQRANCVYRKMREMIAEGAIGELQRVTWIITDWYRSQYYYDTGSWRATWDGEGGGVLINQCPHQLDLVLWVLGQVPKKVTGYCRYGRWRDIEVEDEVTAFFEYENGATGVFITTTGETPGTNRFEVSGSLGKLLCEGGKLTYYKNAEDSLEFSKNNRVHPFGRPGCEVIDVETDGENLQHTAILRNFTNALLGKEDFFVDGREGILSVRLMNAIEYSGWMGGKQVELPVDENDYLRELNVRRESSRKKNVESVTADTSGSFGTK